MKLKKISESYTRTFSAGEHTDNIERVQIQVIDSEGNPIGDAYAHNGSYSVNVSGASTSVSDSIDRIKALLGVEEVEDAD